MIEMLGIGNERHTGERNTIVGDLITRSDAGDGLTEAIFEDNGVVAYCYVTEAGVIKSDVWIYNRKTAPNECPWKNGSDPPYLNPKKYALELSPLPTDEMDVHIEWQKLNGRKPTAVVRIFGKVFGNVSADTKPGYARLARKEGPLAKPLK